MKSAYIEKSLKYPDKIKHYSEVEELELIKRNFEHGRSKCLVVCMEEMSELIEALIEYNASQNKHTVLHLMEEYADVMNCINNLCYICDIQFEDLNPTVPKNNYKLDKNRRNILTSVYKSLTSCIQTISKVIRGKADSNHITINISNLNQSLYDLVHLYDLNIENIELIRMLKYKRLESRLNLIDRLK